MLPPGLVALLKQLPMMSDQDAEVYRRSCFADEPYYFGADSLPDPEIPAGEVTVRRHVSASYPGGDRVWKLYLPAERHRSEPLHLMVFQDGDMYLDPAVNTHVVLDNLIARGEIPPMAAVFMEPGPEGPGVPRYGGGGNRSVEYDSIGASYANFVIDEIVPLVRKEVDLSVDPEHHGAAGISSGGVCAFTMAWERPDFFRKVLSHCGSFVAIRGGERYPDLVRTGEKRPLRVLLQSGANDLDTIFGDWRLANQAMASALAYRGYDHRLIMGEGGHSLSHGAAILPDSLRWLWRGQDQVR